LSKKPKLLHTAKEYSIKQGKKNEARLTAYEAALRAMKHR